MRKSFQHILVILLLPGIWSCKKETDNSYPVIDVLSPQANSQFEYTDHISVQARVIDDRQLESVTVEVLKGNFNPTGGAKTFNPESNEYDLSSSFFLNDVKQATGNYYVKVTASDGQNEKSEFVEFNYSGAPKELTGVYITSLNGNGEAEVYRQDTASGNLFLSYAGHAGDYGGAIVNSWDQQLLIAGSATGDLVAYNPSTFSESWRRDNVQGTTFPYFGWIGFDDDQHQVLVSLSTGQLQAYDSFGNSKFSAFVLTGYQPYEFAGNEEYILSEQFHTGNSDRKLVRYFRGSGTLDQMLPASYNVKGIDAIDSDHFLLVGDDGSNASLEIYDIPGNFTWSPVSLPPGTVNDLVDLNGTYLIAHSAGIFLYNHSTYSLQQVNSVNAQVISVDVTTGSVYAGVANELRVYDLSGNLIMTSPHSASIADVLLLYNK